jgi:hypothetical protein
MAISDRGNMGFPIHLSSVIFLGHKIFITYWIPVGTKLL